jgi:hypothetical protein
VAAVVRQLDREPVRDRIHRWAVLLTIGLGIFLLVLIPGLWLQGWFQ